MLRPISEVCDLPLTRIIDVRCWPACNCQSPTSAISRIPRAFVILGRSKERSDAAQTLGSMPLRQPKNATAQNGTCIRNGARYPRP
ncbi:MAG: hypothetical protein E5Y77_12935 [Mesorhizobium sp.]|nr:MAG: hypothetical protein E5Y77_12935 [Mesorhizobium sp.]